MTPWEDDDVGLSNDSRLTTGGGRGDRLGTSVFQTLGSDGLTFDGWVALDIVKDFTKSIMKLIYFCGNPVKGHLPRPATRFSCQWWTILGLPDTIPLPKAPVVLY